MTEFEDRIRAMTVPRDGAYPRPWTTETDPWRGGLPSGGRYPRPVCGPTAAIGPGADASIPLSAHLKSRVFTLIGSTFNVGSTRSRGLNPFGRLRGSSPGPP